MRHHSSRTNRDPDLFAVLHVLDLPRKIGKSRSLLQCWNWSKGWIHALFGNKRWICRKQRPGRQNTAVTSEAIEPMQLKEFDRVRVNGCNEFLPAFLRVLDLSCFSKELQDVTAAQEELVAEAVLRDRDIRFFYLRKEPI